MRKITELKENFKFKKFGLDQVDSRAFAPDFDDSEWRSVLVPHDWGIEGDFREENDITYSMIIQDGMTKPEPQTGRTGALPIVGEGVYRTWLELDEIETVCLEFDGVMCESEIYINGKKAGGCHFGYLSFEVNITDYVKKGKNLLVVHAKVYPDSSRWYCGGGIYRNVRLVQKPKEYITYNGVWVRQAYADQKFALFDITVNTVGAKGFCAKITDPVGKITTLSTNDHKVSYSVENPMLWDVDSPNLYTVEITIESGDTVSVTFGARQV